MKYHYKGVKILKEDMPYRPCVGIVVVNRQGLVFLGRRIANPQDDYAWQMPQGGIDTNENPFDAALRELYEETSITSVEPLKESPEWYQYDLPDDILNRSWRGRYRGQTQKWFAVRFTGNDDEINVLQPGGGHHKAEFDQWRWATLTEVPALIIPFKRAVYEHVVQDFKEFATG